jgi:hypothetical protein
LERTREVKKRNLQLIGVDYHKQRRDFDDKIVIFYRDLDTGKKEFMVVDDPELEYFVNKDEFWDREGEVTYIDPEKVEKRTSLFRKLLDDMAYEIGEDAVTFLRECKREGKFYYARKLHLNPNMHGSDLDIQDHYIDKFIEEYGSDNMKLHKGYFDIEVDIIDYDGFPDETIAPCPVNIITYFDEQNMKFYTAVHRNPKNESLTYFEENQVAETVQEIISEIKEEDNIDVDFEEVVFFDDEIEVIKYFYSIVNERRPDTCSAWNLKFDALTNMNRSIDQGYTPEEIMCPKEVPYKNVTYYVDSRNQDPADKGDYYNTSSYTQWVDQYLLYANLRKTSGKKESYTLDAVSKDELGKSKLVFGPGETIKNLPWKNFKKFFKYNVKDVFLLHLIERKVTDIDIQYSVAMMTRTRMHKALKKTICLRNLANVFYRQQGYVMSNNHNATYGGDRPESEKFRGAFVSDPNLNLRMGVELNGRRSKFLHENVIDMDLSSLYPSIILAFNVDKSTQIGKILLYNEKGEDISWEFMDNLVSRDWIGVGSRWMGLPDAHEMIKLIGEAE